MSHTFIRNGFIASGLVNILAVLLLSRAFTNAVIPATDPVVMSNFGLLMIAVWGLVFLAAARHYQHAKWVVGAFVVEKLVYAVVWFRWITTHDVAVVYAKELRPVVKDVEGVEIVKLGTYGAKLRVDTKQTPVGAMMAQLAGAGSLVDVTISDASLEEVIRTIYERQPAGVGG